MTRQQLKGHQVTMHSLRDRTGELQRSGANVDTQYLILLLEGLARVVSDLIDERIAESQHAAAVTEEINRGQG